LKTSNVSLACYYQHKVADVCITASAAAAATAAPAGPTPVAFTPAPATSQPFEDLPLSNIRKVCTIEWDDRQESNVELQVIASRLTESKQSIPHYYLTIELQADELLKYV
jgi:pyruvate dehydrogenase E2 component (dihydrolipoamide acetyltransferase)